MERVCTDVEEWEDLKWKGQGDMWENGEFPFRKGMYGKCRYRYGRMGGSKVEKVYGDVGE